MLGKGEEEDEEGEGRIKGMCWIYKGGYIRGKLYKYKGVYIF